MTEQTAARPTRSERRAHSRAALLEATARALSRRGYANLVLEEVAREAGFTRRALCHQFRDKDGLGLAALVWVHDTWYAEVGSVFDAPAGRRARRARTPAAVYGRRANARMMVALRIELGSQGNLSRWPDGEGREVSFRGR